MVNAVHHARTINGQIRRAKAMDESELYDYAKELQVSAIKNVLRNGQNTSSSSIIFFFKLKLRGTQAGYLVAQTCGF